MDVDGFVQLEHLGGAEIQILAAAGAARELCGKSTVSIEVLYPNGNRKIACVEFSDPPVVTMLEPPPPPGPAPDVLAAGVAKLVELGLSPDEAAAVAGILPAIEQD